MLPRARGLTAKVSCEGFMGALMLKLRLVESALSRPREGRRSRRVCTVAARLWKKNMLLGGEFRVFLRWLHEQREDHLRHGNVGRGGKFNSLRDQVGNVNDWRRPAGLGANAFAVSAWEEGSSTRGHKTSKKYCTELYLPPQMWEIASFHSLAKMSI